MNPFKVGDRVRVIHAGPGLIAEDLGAVGRVVEILENPIPMSNGLALELDVAIDNPNADLDWVIGFHHTELEKVED